MKRHGDHYYDGLMKPSICIGQRLGCGFSVELLANWENDDFCSHGPSFFLFSFYIPYSETSFCQWSSRDHSFKNKFQQIAYNRLCRRNNKLGYPHTRRRIINITLSAMGFVKYSFIRFLHTESFLYSDLCSAHAISFAERHFFNYLERNKFYWKFQNLDFFNSVLP